MQQVIERLISESQRAKFVERRTETRHPHTRPVRIFLSDDDVISAFSKNLSTHGIGIVADRELPAGTIATLSIHCTSGPPVDLRCEVRWCDNFGHGWWLTGWKFLNVAPTRIWSQKS